MAKQTAKDRADDARGGRKANKELDKKRADLKKFQSPDWRGMRCGPRARQTARSRRPGFNPLTGGACGAAPGI